jgi:hypothetical protein
MREHAATRTLVKSAPELWLTCSEESLLGRHLDQFGEIRITRLEPESTVAWEGDAASGTVRIEPSGWGTRVTLTVVAKEIAAEPAVAEAVAEEVDGTVVEEELVQSQLPAPPEPVALELDELVAPAQPSEVGQQTAVERATVEGGFWSRLVALLRGAGSGTGHPGPEAPVPAADEPLPAAGGALDPPPSARDAPVMAHVAAETPEPRGDLAPADDPSGPPRELDLDGALTAALESLGRAHHRPYSRS